MSNKITILGSGFGLGFYVPGLLINYHLKDNGINSEVLIFENYIIEDKRNKIALNKQTYHQNFPLALLAQRMPWDIRESIDNDMVEQLLNTWEKENRSNFIVMSGHWIYILDEYRKRINNQPINVDILYIDAEPSPSWKGLSKYNPKYSEDYDEKFIFDADKEEISYYLPIGSKKPIPFKERENRFMIHGGGWGMGTYQERIHELEENGFKLDVIAYKEDEVRDEKNGHRYFMMDPAWKAWDSNELIFPPFAEVKHDVTPIFESKEGYHSSFDVLRNAKAVISKPGGGTLIDSLAAATPIILLEPFGHHEKINADLWEKLDLGIRYETWKESGFKLDMFECMHENLVKQRNNAVNYVEEYINKLVKDTKGKVM
ncbi:UDP-glucuronosyltransferase [Clostridium estertheticum]|uniref:UDP-glucuronosyltransferase n=1 Tax=Clostridium estertheticum TaxID=238834 RepID=UPI001C0CB9D7|nr:UDP-glucuronosyltransferase [Clostridium estertheticum]MBU3178016.1 UDP-glucuronosyltransferase [Clostridium estertheticum]